MGIKHDDFVRFRVNWFSWLSGEKGTSVNELSITALHTQSLIVSAVGLFHSERSFPIFGEPASNPIDTAPPPSLRFSLINTQKEAPYANPHHC